MGATQSQIRTTNGTTYRRGRRSFSSKESHQKHYGLQHPAARTSSTHHLQPPLPGASASAPSVLSHPQHIKSRQNSSSQHAAGSCSPPASYISLSSSSLQRAFGRRRSSNQTVDSVPSSLSSTLCSNQSSARFSGDTSCAAGSASDEEFRYIHGRRYHNTSSLYMLPNDAEEVDRLHLQHYIYKLIVGGKNLHVPLAKENSRVIDLGCGPATWTMDMATELTNVNFVGVDISPIFPALIHPRNCAFYRENILEGLSQPDNSFDVAYQRSVAPGFTLENWQQAVKEAYRLLKPGGWFESVEADVTIEEAGPSTIKCFDLMRCSMASRNVDPAVVRNLNKIMIETGFVDVQVKEYCVPFGEWGAKLGMLWKQNITSILETAKPHLAKAGGISEAQVTEMTQAMIKESQEHRAYQIIYVAIGRKQL